TVKGTYPLRGDYTVTLKAYTSGGSAESSQVINIAQTNPALLDIPEFNLLTGGVDALDGKTWVIDGNNAGHMGVGPITSMVAEWWQAPPLDKDGQGIYDDEITFKLLDFVYEFKNNGDIFAQGLSAPDLGGTGSGEDQLVNYAPGDQTLNWSFNEDDEGRQFLTISDGGFFGFYTGVSRYEILVLEENEMYVRFEDTKDPARVWYHRLIPKGFTPPPPPPPAVVDVFKVDFESEDTEFGVFGGQTFQVIDNPDAAGINTSARVGETVHGNETWAGVSKNIGSTLDFSVKNGFRMKTWSPVSGIVRFKLENSANPEQDFVEVDANITHTNEWSELTFDFSGAQTELYDQIAVFFDFGNSDPNTFYFDDIEFVQLGAPITELNLDFENGEPVFDVFGGQDFSIIANPDASGLNTSANVAQSIKGNETWAGQLTTLDGKLDFSQNSALAVKIWSPVIGTMMLKLEDAADAQNTFVEIPLTNTKTEEWEELIFNFEGQPSGVYNNVVLFLDFDNSSQGTTFYFDDIRMTNPPVEFSASTLTGDGTKAWKLAPQAAALAVGPGPGSAEWWSNGAEEVEGGRACWFNDEYIFSNDGTYSYDAKGDIFAEAYMGVESDGCIAEGDIPTDAAAWASGSHTFEFTPASGDQPATISVTGTGAFIALPKAINGGELASAPPPADATVTYEVLDYVQSPEGETLVLTIDISEGQVGGSYWTFTLTSVQ
ncbi:MAG: hypothetical protein AAFO07_05460, partial [Bacteroidota bacterium]